MDTGGVTLQSRFGGTRNYPDYIFFKHMDSVRKGFCTVLNLHDGLLFIELEKDGKEHIIPNKSLIELIRNAREEQ